MNSFFNCGVYRWLNTMTGKSYVGSSTNVELRKKEHLRDLAAGKHHSLKLQRAWDKYGSEVFEFEMLAFCPEDNLLLQEQLALNAFDSVRHGYNVASYALAPMRGRKHSKDTLLRISAAQKGKPKSATHVQKISDSLRGKPKSEEAKRNHRQSVLAVAEKTGRKISAAWTPERRKMASERAKNLGLNQIGNTARWGKVTNA